MPFDQTLRTVLTNPQVLAGWAGLVALSLAVLVYDLRANNSGIAPLMKFVWGLTVLYSGPLGLAVYAYSGRAAIERDSLWRRGFRSVAHCYSGCGAGEVVGITIAAGLLALASHWVIAITFACAYVFGYGLTVGPLVQEGESLATAMKDALYSETPSITVMEIAAIGTDVWLAGEATITEPLFWSALVFSLTVGLLVAYPVNVLLVYQGVKEGMQNPRQTAAST
ncbi:DUF4396 domain-containing protein [Halorarius litoreus]|uniref:DUF4396 domain-containing protein n=1 Tax=Halorarius litoreus TaxID=2962676 RepID=UPI0020CFB945|nr:DUF4396 domain-containing protein [Halorarius litoreus]